MCTGGGQDNTQAERSNELAEENARIAKEERERKERNFDTISGFFNNNKQFDDTLQGIQSATFNKFLPDLERQEEKANRQLKFQLARQGLTGGRAEIDGSQEILENKNRGITEIGARALAAKNRARSVFEGQKTALQGQALSGADINTLNKSANASIGLANNAFQQALQERDLGNFFTAVTSGFNNGVNNLGQTSAKAQLEQLLFQNQNKPETNASNGVFTSV